jgi:polysaccharide biosynthesis PFTS motif protein
MKTINLFLYIFFFGFDYKNKIIIIYKKLGKNRTQIYILKNKLLNLTNKQYTNKIINDFFIAELNILKSFHQYVYGKIIHNRIFNILLINSIVKKKHLIYPLPKNYLNIISKDVKVNFYLCSLAWNLFLICKVILSCYLIFCAFFSFLKFKNNFFNIYLNTHLNAEINKSISKKKLNLFEWIIANFKTNKKIIIFHKIKKLNKNIIEEKKYTLKYKKNTVTSIFYFNEINLYFKSISKIFLFSINCIIKSKKNYLLLFDEIFYYFLINYKKKVFDLVLFDNPNFSYRPLWTFANEHIKKGSVQFFFYSINNYSLGQFTIKEKHYEGLPIKLINWPNYVFWNQKQLNWFKTITNNKFNFKIIQPGIFEGYNLYLKKSNLKRLTIFDVAPQNDFEISTMINPYNIYNVSFCKSFLADLFKLIDNSKIEVFLKTKRNSLSITNPSYLNFIKVLHKEKKINKIISGDISAESIIKNSDAVICIPFSSPAIIAETMSIKSAYYDPTGKINSSLNFGVKTKFIKNKVVLKKWIKKI